MSYNYLFLTAEKFFPGVSYYGILNKDCVSVAVVLMKRLCVCGSSSYEAW